MAIYPKMIASNLQAMVPALGNGHWPIIIGLVVVFIGVAWNLTGSEGVSALSVVVTVAVVGLFVLLVTTVVGKSIVSHIQGGKTPTISTESLSWLLFGRAMARAMWNYMGWDNCSTIASEVESPQQTYPRALRYNLVLVALNYCVPVGIMTLTGESSSSWEMGHWVLVAKRYAGSWLSIPIAIFGIASAFAMFVTLMMSYARIVMALARDGWLPRVLGATYGQRRIPVFAIFACAIVWSALLQANFDQLFGLDVMLYGGSLVLQFASLIALRIREPNLSRPFRIWGGLPGVIAVAIPPTALLIGTLFYNRSEQIAGMSVFTFGGLIAVAGVLVCGLRWRSYRSVAASH
jgi:amino acid transporter